MRAPNIFTISPALPFLDTFVDAFLRGAIVPDVAPADDPLALADATIYVPTRRAARTLGGIFLARSAAGAAILPRILPLGALEATETELLAGDPDPAGSGLPLPPAASSIWRRLRLTTLIETWSRAIDGAIVSIDAQGRKVVDRDESFRVAASTVDAFALAGELAALIDEMKIEGVAWHALDDLRLAGFDDYWRITTTFLKIATDQWPKTLDDAGVVDPSTRQIELVDAQARELTEGRSRDPVIALGSTGTNKATARLLSAIAAAPRGAIVLPGLDRDLDDASWALISGRHGENQEPSYGHPQAAMARLLPVLEVVREAVVPIGAPESLAETRVRFVAEALRPADTTDLWRKYRNAVPQASLAAALAGVSLIEAADEREEALCLAIAMRKVLETPGRTAALVTPDRELARRVRGELLRWNVDVFDSGGEPLARRPLGVLARLVAAAAASRMSARDVGSLLAQPLACLGRDRREIARRATRLEVGVLRVVSVAATNDPFAAAQESAADRHAHPAQKGLRDEDWVAMEALWNSLREALAPLLTLEGSHGLDRWVAAHRAALAAIVGEADPDEHEALDDLFDELSKTSDHTLRFNAVDYGIFFGRIANEVVLRATNEPHPRLQILGLLEARLIDADVMLLGGLDEGIWPPQAKSDAFLNRPMRADLGLLPPERRLGQTAHDFAQAMGHQTVILSRAKKRGGSPMVASRFLLRLQALGGKAWDACRERGRDTLDLSRALDGTQFAPKAIQRPRPAPDVELRPQHLSVTEIETLRRDPYSIYAAKILRLAPLPRVGAEVDAGEFGSLMHEALQDFVLGDAADGTDAERRAALDAIVREKFAEALRDTIFRAFRWPIIDRSLVVFLKFDREQRDLAREIKAETSGAIDVTLADLSAFKLTARADRIDFHRDGMATLIDYKTGQPPGLPEVKVGFAPQLTLEAAILREGGFGGTPHTGEIGATYLKLGGKDGGFRRPLKYRDEPFSAIVDRHFAGMTQLLSSFRNPKTAYPSRPFPKYARTYGDFDYLARVREWSLAADDEGVL